jgi:hydroxymethylpyrimidine kinase/phosphomethylpyrimidine kinase/thiamine-phosphate diphosphorylase
MTYDARPFVWNIAGSDSFGAAGVQSDIKTITMHGCHCCQALTAVTSQTPSKLLSSFVIPAHELASQLAAIGQGPKPKAIKIGMIGSRANLSIIREALSTVQVPVVLDPISRASSGSSLAGDILPRDYFEFFASNRVFLTPNIPEAEALTGRSIKTSEDIVQAAKYLLEKGATQVLIKGGHAETLQNVSNHQSIDFYCDRSGLTFFVKSQRKNVNLRGTGCTLASAIAANLAHDHEPADAVVLAKAYLNQCFDTHEKIDSQTAIARHLPLTLKTDLFPEVELGDHLSNTDFNVSPADRTGFYVIVDSSNWVSDLIDWKVPSVQLRIKNPQYEALYPEIKRSIAKAQCSTTKLYINDHWRLAIDLNAYGVHLGQEDLLNADIAAIKSAGLRLGISTHSWFEAAVAHRYRPSYIALGPVFPTTCKSMRFGPQGFEKLEQWKKSWPYPVVAIGGLKVEHARKLNKCGVDGVAVISDITEAGDPRSQVRAWITSLERPEQQ